MPTQKTFSTWRTARHFRIFANRPFKRGVSKRGASRYYLRKRMRLWHMSRSRALTKRIMRRLNR